MKTSAGALTSDQIAEIRNDIRVGNVPAHPDTTMTFDEYIDGFPAWRRSGWVFGSGVAGADGSKDALGRTIVKSRATLAQEFEPQGAQIFASGPFTGYEFNPGGGWDFVCTSVFNQPAPAGSPLAGAPNEQVFSFEADCLRMQRVLQYGSHQTYLVGNVTGSGINCNVVGGTTPTPIANFGRVSADIATMNVGDIVSIYDKLVFITAKNQGGGTLTVTKVLGFFGGGMEVISDAWRNVQFHRFAAARTTNASAFVTGAAGPFSVEDPIPAHIVPGCTLALSPGPGGDILPIGHTRIKSIDRTGAKHTFTLEIPMTGTPYASVPVVVFVPTVWSPQLASKTPQGPIDCGIYAMRQTITLPDVEARLDAPVYTGADVNASIAAEPKGVKQDGAWYAAWFNVTSIFADAFLNNGRVRTKRTEIDKPWELFPSRSQSGNTWSGNIHARGVHRDKDGNISWDYMLQGGDSDKLVNTLVDGASQETIAATDAAIGSAINTAFSGVSGVPAGSLTALKSAIMSALSAFSPPLHPDAAKRQHAKEEFKSLFAPLRTRVMNAAKTAWRIAGSHWIDPAFGDPNYSGDASGGVLSSRGAHRLCLPTTHRIMAGVPVETQIVWTREWAICYVAGEPICITWWDITDQEQPYTFILDVLGHSIKSWAWGNGFFNRDTAHIAEHWMKVHSIDVWRGA